MSFFSSLFGNSSSNTNSSSSNTSQPPQSIRILNQTIQSEVNMSPQEEINFLNREIARLQQEIEQLITEAKSLGKAGRKNQALYKVRLKKLKEQNIETKRRKIQLLKKRLLENQIP